MSADRGPCGRKAAPIQAAAPTVEPAAEPAVQPVEPAAADTPAGPARDPRIEVSDLVPGGLPALGNVPYVPFAGPRLATAPITTRERR